MSDTWEERARKTALALKTEYADPWTSSPKQRKRYAQLRYAMYLLVNEVAE